MSFVTFHTNNRLYVCAAPAEVDDIRNTILTDAKEMTGLGMKEYSRLPGFFLAALGYALKKQDEAGRNLYINKRSFCNLILRLNSCTPVNPTQVSAVQALYEAPDEYYYRVARKVYERVIQLLPLMENHRDIGSLSRMMLAFINMGTIHAEIASELAAIRTL